MLEKLDGFFYHSCDNLITIDLEIRLPPHTGGRHPEAEVSGGIQPPGGNPAECFVCCTCLARCRQVQ
jgi:hypothetical protein